MDPQLISIIIHEHTDFVPVVAGAFFKVPIVKYFLRKLHAVKVPNLKKGNRDTEVLERINKEILAAFEMNKSALIFPAGHISIGGLEKIAGKQGAYSIASLLPEKAKIIGVKITGLYGSIWSSAWNGKRPEFFSTFLKAIIYFFANLIFFCPRRAVTFEFIDITEEAKQKASIDRKAFNTYMEDFYNADGPEKPNFVRHLFYFPRIKNKVGKAK
jgi:long-chain-fatty-acid--[acyl-carrier-protein] ligase